MQISRVKAITILLITLTFAVGGLALFDWIDPKRLNGLPVRQAALTVLAVLIAWLVSRAIDHLADGLNEGRSPWQRRLRRMVHVADGERFREADLFAALLHMAIWLTLPLLLLRVWGLSKASFDILRHLAWTGFPVGQVQIVPAQLLLGALLLVIFATLIRWITGRMETKWLARTPMELHTREAVATIVGYVLFVIAAMVVLSYIGLDLTKLAFIAGALSVGIGFGLQTIVNNFVSGLILLFEQPIRSGNYVTVGETEGFVRRIRIRATEVETLDRTTVIVPNSELLTQHVRNWNLRDRYGRIICPVRVAFGSDVKRVQQLLLDIGESHQSVISDGIKGVPKPMALFRGFGDSALDFELRCYVRDITRRFPVISDINFSIEAAFREHGITIAFPQMDIWHRSMPPADNSEEDVGELSS